MKQKRRVIALFLVCAIMLTLLIEMDVFYASSNPYAESYVVHDNGDAHAGYCTCRTIVEYHPGNCTWVAWQEAYDRLGVALPGWSGNAKTWYNHAMNAGYTVIPYSQGVVPPDNSIVCWSGTYGHVAWILSADSAGANVIDGNIYVNGAWQKKYQHWCSWSSMENRSGLTIQGFIVFTQPVSGVSLNKSTATLTEKGATVALTATVSPSNATDKSVTWTSSNTSVATVDSSSGLVTAVGNGTATITATTKSGGKTATCEVTVALPVLKDGWYYTSVLPSGITSDKYDIQYQNTYVKYATSSPGTGWVDTGVDKKEYTESGNLYETDWPIETSDTVRLVEYYYYHYCGENTAWNDVNYYKRDSYTHRDEMHLNYFSVYEYASGTDIEDSSIIWYHLKWVDENGYDAYCHRKSTGGTCDGSEGEHESRSPYWYKKYVYQNYTVQTLNQYQKTSAWETTKDSSATTVNIRYRLKPVSVTVNPTSATLTYVGQTLQLTATVSPSDAGDKSVTWTSNNTAVATVSSNGVVTAKGNGTAKITATTNSGGKTASCTITVSIAVEKVELNNTSATLKAKGETLQLIATVSPSNAANKNVTWDSSDDDVVTVDSNGLVEAVGNGTATITVTTESGKKTATCTVTVSIEPERVWLDKTSATLTDIGQTLQLHATVGPYYAENHDVTWESSDTSVATVDANGRVRAKRNGTAIITVTTVAGSKTATCRVTVSVAEDVVLNKVKATFTSAGETMQLIATVLPNDTINKNVTWESSNPSVAMVDENGLVTAVGNGTAKITVITESGEQTAACNVTVNIEPVKVGLNKTSATLTDEGQTLQLIATISPTNAANKNVTWKSSNTSVATVDSNGLVTAVGDGTATITVTTESGSLKATCTVTVDATVPLVIVSQPKSQTADEDETVLFTVSAEGKNISYQWQFSKDGSYWSNSSMTGATTASMQVQALASRDGYQYRCVVTDAKGQKCVSNAATLTVNTMTITAQPKSQDVTVNEYTTFDVKVDGNSLKYQWQFSKDGSYWSNSSMEGSTTASMKVQALASRDGYQYRCVITDVNGKKITTEAATLKVNPIVITAQPESQDVTINEYMTLTVKAEGTGLKYQWQCCKDGEYWFDSSMTGATTASMKVQALTSRDGYQYRCVITDANGKKAITEPATLTVNTIVITAQPESQAIKVNEYTDFTVKAEGTGLKYQWQFCRDGEYWSNSSMTGSTTASMEVQALIGRDGYQYRCVITDANGKKVITEPATLTVKSIVITQQPENQTVLTNKYTAFTVEAEGTGLKYQWQFCKDGSYWSNSSMTGSTTASMQVQALAGRDGYQYRCVITDANGKQVVTEPATLTVSTVVITSQPADKMVSTNKYTTFTVKAEGTGLTYQWQFCKDGKYWSNSSMAGSTTATMQVQGLASRNGYQYRCVVTDVNGNKVISEAATLTVGAIAITSQPESKTVSENGYTTFTVKAEGTGLKYQWQFCKDGEYWSNSSMAGSTTASMQVQALASRDGYQYRCIVTDANGNQVISDAAELTIK